VLAAALAACAAAAGPAGEEPTLAEERAFRAAVERVAAAVVRIEPVATATAPPGAEAGAVVDVAALMRFCAEHVHERAALPAEVIQVAEMPLTAVGKIAKPVLRIDIVRRTVEAIVREHVDGAMEADVSVDSSGRRPKVTVRLACASPAGLAYALAAYEFESEVVVSSAPRSAAPRP
jgi:fatty-acyl-CoA synthase